MAIALLATLSLSIVGGEPVAAPAATPRRLVVMVDERGFESWPGLYELEREFEARHAGLDVVLLEQGGAVGQQDKARFLLAGELQLDVTRIDVTEFGAYLGEAALVDLEPFFQADPSWRAEDYLPVIDGLRDARGHLYGLPSTFTPYVMYFNRDVLRAAGVDDPRAGWTWEQFLAACRATTRDLDGDGRVDQWGVSLTQWLQALTPWIWQNGGELLDGRGERSRLHDPEVVAALEFVRSLLHTERVASFDASFEVTFSQGLFQAGRAAFYGPVGYWETYRFKYIDAFEWDVAPLPCGRREATAIAMTAYVVPRTSREPELAYEFVRALAGPRFQGLLARIGNGAPGLRSAATSTDFLDPHRPPRSEQVFLDVLPTARFLPPLANWRAIEDLCAQELAQVLLAEQCDVAQACQSMSRKVDQHLERERARAGLTRLRAGSLEVAFAASVVAALALGVRSLARSRSRLQRGEQRAALLLLAPWALGAALLFVGPAACTALLALCEWSPLRPLSDVRWVGAGNFARLLDDPTFHASLRASFAYAATSVPLGLVLALALALLLREHSRWSALTRTLVYAPSLLSPVVVAIVWRFVLDPDQGLLNQILLDVGLEPIAWTRSERAVLPAFVLMSCWSVGGQMLVFLAALQALDPQLEEAARVDGAGWWRRLWHVTLPQLSPVVVFNVAIGLLGAFNVFAQPYLLTQGGPGDATRFVALYLYESGFRRLDMGYAAAIAAVVFAALALATGLLLRASRRWVYYAARSAR